MTAESFKTQRKLLYEYNVGIHQLFGIFQFYLLYD